MNWLAANGFTIARGVADMPTAFIASFGSGHPIIGILAESDALPGLSQKASPLREEREGSANGHACGHSIFGTASTTAVIAVRQAMTKHGMKGTIRLCGTPAEETGIGKIYIAKGAALMTGTTVDWHVDSDTHEIK